jgi:hypothetical protein
MLMSVDASADNGLLGLYVGAGAGAATVHQFSGGIAGPLGFASSRVGWKLMAGIRPLSWLGAEAEFIDFGSAHVGPSTQNGGGLAAYNQFYGADANARAGALFAVGYLPLRISWMDIFGKIGVASLRVADHYAGNFPNVYLNCQVTCAAVGQISTSESSDSTGLAYAGGVQFHFQQMSIRLEYEGMNSKITDNPTLASLGLTWSF